MEAKYKSLSIFDFQTQFPDEASCYKHLAELKWSKGFKCRNCGHDHYCDGTGKLARQCTSCHIAESATSGTLFHGVKFSILKAFYIVYYISTNKSGIASTELSRKLELRQKTAWLFKQKVMKAMESSGNFPLVGKVESDRRSG
jgi:Transposase zinc-ribbon domain